MTLEAILSSPALAGMRAERKWVVYIVYPDPKKPGKLTKIPSNFQTGLPCSVVDPANWTDVHTAAAAVRQFGPGFGLGYCFTEDSGRWFVDLDSCKRADGSWSPLAQQVHSALAGAAVEVSASGNGLHFFGRGTVPRHASKNIEQHAELYTAGRFCAMTGTSLQGDCDVDLTPAITWLAGAYFTPKNAAPADAPDDGPCAGWRGPADDADLLRRMLRSQSAGAVFGGKASFADLWDNNVEVLHRAYPGDGDGGIDRSSADAALAQMLAFWTGKDAARMIRLMQQSALVRAKWEDREDYLPRTVANACALQREVLQDKPPAPPTAPVPPPDAPPAPPSAAAMTAREGSTFLDPTQAAVLFHGCVYIADQHRVLVPGGKLYKPEQFKAVFGGYMFAMDARNEKHSRNAFEAFTESSVLRPPVADGTAFQPSLPYGTIIESEGRTRANQFWPAQVRRVRGDPSRFLRHLEILFPNGLDRRTFLYWMTNVVQHPGHKSQWMPLLVGVEGNGKSLFSRCLAFAVGHRYTHWPDASGLGNKFNAYLFGKLLICIEDLKIGDAVEIWEKLKPMITGESLEIEGKGIDQRTDEVCANFIANSNHKNAIRATINDRRVCHLWCAQQDLKDLAPSGLDEAYMAGFYKWLKQDGYAVVAEYLATLEIPPEFGLDWFKGRAPKTSNHVAAVEASRGPVEQEILEAVEREDVGFKGGWISSGKLDTLLERMGRQRTIALNKRREILQGLGYDWHPALPSGRVNNLVLPDAAKVKLFIRSDNASALALMRPADVAAAYTQAQGVVAAAR